VGRLVRKTKWHWAESLPHSILPILFLAAALAAHGQGPQTTPRVAGGTAAEQRGKQIVDEAIAALGGDDFLGMTDIVAGGRAYSFYRERLSGLAIAKIYTRYRTVPGAKLQVEERQAYGKKEEDILLFTPEGEAYEMTFRGARPVPPDRTERYYDTTMHNVFYILRVRLHEKGMIFESKGADVIDNMPVEIVDITDSEDRTTTVYFHQSTKLPARQVFYHRDPKTRERDEELTLFSKYRAENGVQWPHAIHRERNGEKIFEMFSDSVVINKGLPDKLFELPADAKKLKPIN
jgi:hypothetical protein